VGADHQDRVCRRPGTATGNTTIHNAPPQYTAAEEKIHAGSHGAGLLLSIAGLVWMLNLSFGAADAWRIVASGIYGFSLISLFLTSTLYHGLHDSPHRELFKLLDHLRDIPADCRQQHAVPPGGVAQQHQRVVVRRNVGDGRGRNSDQTQVQT
jgi:hypothetical protein